MYAPEVFKRKASDQIYREPNKNSKQRCYAIADKKEWPHLQYIFNQSNRDCFDIDNIAHDECTTRRLKYR